MLEAGSEMTAAGGLPLVAVRMLQKRNLVRMRGDTGGQSRQVAFWLPIQLNGSVLGSELYTPIPSHRITSARIPRLRKVSDA